MVEGLFQDEVLKLLAEGGRIRNVLVITKQIDDHVEHLACLRVTGHAAFLPLRTWGNKADKLYRDFDRLLALLREEFGFQGGVIIYREEDPDLARFRALACESTGSLLDQLEDNLLRLRRSD